MKSDVYVAQDDGAHRDVWVDIAPDGDFAGQVWRRTVSLEYNTGEVDEPYDWQYSASVADGFDTTELVVPDEVEAEYEKLRSRAFWLVKK